MSNNPFAPDPAQQYPPVSSFGGGGGGTPQFSQPQNSYLSPQATGYPGTSTGGSGFQPQSSFGQALQAQVTGAPSGGGGGFGSQPSPQPGYLQQQQTGFIQQQPTGYYQQQQPQQQQFQQQPQQQQFQQQPQQQQFQQQPQQQQFQPQAQPGPQASQPNFLDLDPYASLSNASFSQAPSSTSTPSVSSPPQSSSTPSVHLPDDHPRTYVNAHKAELERWDPYHWRQLLTRFDDLINAWEGRKKDIDRLFGWRVDDLGKRRREQLERENEDRIGQIHASKFQVKEVQDSYRHSSDSISRERVRSAINDGLRSLPEWPGNLEEQEREIIATGGASGSAGMQPQATGFVQQQPTGYGGYGQQPFQQQQQPQQQQQFLGPQATGFVGGGGYGYGGGFMQQQPTGFVQQQPTGYPGQGFF